MSEEESKQRAVAIGDYLAENICAGTKEEALLKELWDVATFEE